MKTDFTLEGKVIIVTGATGVLGEAFVNGIAAAGGIVGVLIECFGGRVVAKRSQKFGGVGEGGW